MSDTKTAFVTPTHITKKLPDIRALLERGNPGYMKVVHVYFHRYNHFGKPYSEVDAVVLNKQGRVVTAYAHDDEVPREFNQRYLKFDPVGQSLSDYLCSMMRHEHRKDQVVKVLVALDGFGDVVIKP